MVSALHGNGEPWARAACVAGISLQRAEKDKEDTYPELVDSGTALPTTLACEVGGRCNAACQDVGAELAASRARAAPRHLQLSARLAYEARWWAMLSCTQQGALAATLVDDGVLVLDGHDAAEPVAAEVLVDQLHCEQFG